MSQPTVGHFDFGQSSLASNTKRQKEDNRPPDTLILVDAFWIKDGMIIKFIPHQMKVDLIVVFKLEHDDGTCDRDKAEFKLSFEVPGTQYEGENKEIVIKYSDIKENLYQNLEVKRTCSEANDDGHDWYYYIINNFTSDLSEVAFEA